VHDVKQVNNGVDRCELCNKVKYDRYEWRHTFSLLPSSKFSWINSFICDWSWRC